MPSAPHIAEPVGECPSFRRVLEMARRAARRVVFVVLLCGEVGVGKEEIARYIHALRGADGPFLTVQVGARPVEDFRAELLGVSSSVMTGGEGRAGQLEQVGDGTLFLPDIEQLAPILQGDLAGLAERHEFRRVGEVEIRVPHFYVIAATTRDLREMVANGAFRSDLCCCFDACCIVVPPLRERREDIPLLAETLLSRIAVPGGMPRPELDPDVVRWLQGQDWPENVLGLKSFLERAVLVADDGVISLDVAEEAWRLVGGASPSTRLTGKASDDGTRRVVLSVFEDEAQLDGVPVVSAIRAPTRWAIFRYFVDRWLEDGVGEQERHRFHQVSEIRRELRKREEYRDMAIDAVQKDITRLREALKSGGVIETSPHRKGYRLRSAGLAVEIVRPGDVVRASKG